MTDGVSLADIAAVTDNKDGMFGGAGGGGMWIFALLILLLIGGGSFFGGNRAVNGEPVTEAGLCNAMNFNNLENAVGRLNDNLQHDYPNATTYTAGMNPYWNNSCCNNGVNI